MADGLTGSPLDIAATLGGDGAGLVRGLWRVPAADGLVLVRVDLSVAAFDEAAFDTFGVARPARLARAVAGRRLDYLSGRIAARGALAQLGLQWRDIGADTTGMPLWPEALAGSISHADGTAVAALSTHHARVGVDLEPVAEGAALEALREETLDAAERERLVTAHDATLGFSAKESLYKALFPDVREVFGYDAAAVGTPGAAEVDLVLRRDLGAGYAAGRRFAVHWRSAEGRVLTWLAEGGRRGGLRARP
ncbi:4'-phosphopantetheinyl transferase Npt [Roseivivax jejudonensis]|uniref:Enterobactin synthase component D n=1 Tax=Roseivivax jejudonensis TaxID=1529041 RepID=A0A1X6YL20_9RHOB|nr:4'-phosphopantetheinyl transferase superfamily protein [Roseivivax jejudonensis]SLN24174.1 4'-phosphopantetheinyl transferase Npt [Roseivivax jejudonensis]